MDELEKLYHIVRSHAPEVGLGFFLRGLIKEGGVEGVKYLIRRKLTASPQIPTEAPKTCQTNNTSNNSYPPCSH